MRTLTTTAIVVLTLAAAGPAATQAQTPKLAATLNSCTTGTMATERALRVTASMPANAKAVRMSMRFELQQRRSGVYKKVKMPLWNAWMRSDPKVPGFVFERSVDSLQSPATYRVVVRFRWHAANGKLIRAASKTAAKCRQTAVVALTPTAPTG